MYSKPLILAFVLALLLGFISCGDDTDYVLANMEEIEQYLVDNNLTSESTPSGLHYIIEREGEGDPPGPFTQVEVKYRGYFPDGEEFDNSGEEARRFPLNGVILGWQEGIPKFKKGGKGVLLIPSHLGYGKNGQNSIPGNAVLIFDIEVIDY